MDPSIVRKIFSASGKEPRFVAGELLAGADRCLNHLSRMAKDTSLDSGGTIRNGEPCGEIEDLASKQNADLIVTGQMGNSGREQAAICGVTEQVIGHAPCPVPAVP
jgi:nucleotide-binding universal stress UspA family protein